MEYKVVNAVPCHVDSLFTKGEQKILNTEFSKLEERTLNKKFFRNADVLNEKIETRETYFGNPKGATRLISFPIILNTQQGIFGIFGEEAGLSGGKLFLYKRQDEYWEKICITTLYLV